MPTIRISDEMYEAINGWADYEGRSRNNMAVRLLERGLKGYAYSKDETPPTTSPPSSETPPPPKIPEPQTPKVSDLLNAPDKVPVVDDETKGELACCKNQYKPCKHWQWDTSAVCYINSLSGRCLDVDE